MADGARVETERWRAGFEELLGRIAPRFARVEPRRRAAAFLRGLLAGLGRVNCWTIAEYAGEANPHGMQHLLARAVWDHDEVTADLRDYVVDHLGGAGAAEGVLIVDETGDLKKGTHTVGVQRQYTGTAGRIENAQVGVYLTYATPRGYAFLDRALYLPKVWAEDPGRRHDAGVPEDVVFATKPALAGRMIERAVASGIPAAWVTGDEVYGADPALRTAVAGHGLGYVLAVAKTHRVTTGIGPRRAVDLAQRPDLTWHRASCGPGAKGHRSYDWAWINIPSQPTGEHGLLIRQNRRTSELAFYRTYSPHPVPLARLVTVAGTRWRIEESFQSGKDLTGLDQHQVRTWTSWHRWTALAMLAHAFLSVMTAEQTRPPAHPTSASLIPLTRQEIRRLFTSMITTMVSSVHHVLTWSHWRRQHQTRARTAHYNRRARQDE